MREQCAWQFSVFWVKDVPGSVYPLIDLDFGFDEMSSLGGGQELNGGQGQAPKGGQEHAASSKD